MPLGNGEVFQPDRRVDLAFQLAQKFARTGIDGAPVDGAKPCAWRMAEEDIFANRQLIEQHGFLMNGSDARIDSGLSTGKLHRLSIQQNFAFGRAVDAGEDFDERGFARAVFADQRRDLPG